jgi:hypothetical protein
MDLKIWVKEEDKDIEIVKEANCLVTGNAS